ncbi:MAG: hypothetical protein AB8B55_08110 [Mariniblastus sp.]
MSSNFPSSNSRSGTFSTASGVDWLEERVRPETEQRSQSVVVVEIPDVGSLPVLGSGQQEECDAITETLTRAAGELGQPEPENALPFASANAVQENPAQLRSDEELGSIQESMKRASVLASIALPNVAADISEKPVDWTESPPDTSKTSRVSKIHESQQSDPSDQRNGRIDQGVRHGNESNFGLKEIEKGTSGDQKDDEKTVAIQTLVTSILDRFPVGDPTVIVFVGCEENTHTDETCARVASALADRNIGRIMLIDSDVKGRALSSASGLQGQPGLAEIVNTERSWVDLVYGRSSSGLDFVAAGSGKLYHPERQDRLRTAINGMKKEYQFICVSAGDAHGKSAKIWNDICDGTYLLVSMKNSNETIAKSAVAELQANGARLLGCVVTDAS